MKSYEEIKTKIIENKEKIVLGLCFVLVFIIGFGTGKYEKQYLKTNYKPQSNYTITNNKKPLQNNLQDAGQVLGQGTTIVNSTSTANCIIKGNISASGKKIFHVQGGAYYKIVKPEQCFNTEAEAVAAGFSKSGR